MDTIKGIIRKYPDVRTVFIFGSRARGNFSQTSDIDLAIMNSGVTDAVIARLKDDFHESSLPYFIDLINYPALRHPDLQRHIQRVGMPFYQRDK